MLLRFLTAPVFGKQIKHSLGSSVRLLSSAPGKDVQLIHLKNDKEGIAVIALQRAAAKNSFR